MKNYIGKTMSIKSNEENKESKHPGGRPTSYEPKFCDKVIELFRDGSSIAEIAYELDVAKSTIYEWIDKNEEFSNAMKKGKDISEGWWCKKGRVNIDNKDFNSTLWYMNMKNRFGWSDKQESTHNVNVTETQKKVRDADSEYKY